MSRRNRHGRSQPFTASASAPVARTAFPVAPVSERPLAEARPPLPNDDRPGSGAMERMAPPVPAPAVAAPAVAAPAPLRASEPQPGPLVHVAPPPAFAPIPREDSGPTCTQAQLRRFIKSRPWIPMHELRRRFGITGDDDDVSPVRVPTGMIFVGLPLAEGRMLGELLAGGDVGYELSLDPVTPIVVGVYPMRPVPRG